MEVGGSGTSPGEDPAPSGPSTGYRRAADGAIPFDEGRVRPPVSIGGTLAALGSLIFGAGTLFEMVSATIGPAPSRISISQTYLDTDNGKVVAVVGVIALVLALATLVRPARSIAWPIAVAACGLAALGLAVYDRIRLDDVGDDLRQRIYRDAHASGVVHVSIGPALYIVIAGAILATIGAVLASRDR